VRSVGIVRVTYKDTAKVHLLVDLMDAEQIARLPEPAFEEILGAALPRLALAPFEHSAPAKLRQALRQILAPEMNP